MSKSIAELKKDVLSKVGSTIQTMYGPSLVVGLDTDGEGNMFVLLKEFGEEDYAVAIEEWESLQS